MKKFLSLVLALVMTMSLVTISAGAEDFTDDASINYEEAVDVMSAIGVVGGYADGSFNPTAGLTRGAAAKIICNLILGPTTAAALNADTAPYKDVATDNTFAGYIAYCAKEGIISGYADGTFRPAAPLTGYAFQKMLLGALGYAADVEGYTGANWSINVAKQAIGIGLNAGLKTDFNGSKAVTREEACLFAFNTLKATMVEYDTTITIGDITIAGSKASDVANTAATETIKNDNKLQFAEKYFTKLTKKVNETDDFGRPAVTWVNNKTEVGTYVDYTTLAVSYTTGVDGGDVYSDIGSAAAKFDVVYWEDGKLDKTVDEASDLNIVKGEDDDLTNSGKGVLSEVYVDTDEEVVTVVTINTYLAEVTADYNAKKEYVSVDVKGHTTGKIYLDDVAGIEDLKADDMILVNIANDVIVAVQDAEMIENSAITKFKTSNYYVVDGTQYNQAKNLNMIPNTNPDLTKYDQDALKDYTYNLYLDQYGYVIGIEVYSGTAKYVFVVGYDKGTSGLSAKTADAAVIFTDGTMDTVQIDVYDSVDASGNKLLTGTNVSNHNTWYKYSEDDGVYTLEPATNVVTIDGAAVTKINCENVRLVDSTTSAKAWGNDDSAYIAVTAKADATDVGAAITKVDAVFTGVQDIDLTVTTALVDYNGNKQDDAAQDISETIWAVYDSNNYIIAAIVRGEDTTSTTGYVYGVKGAQNEAFANDYYYWDFEAVVAGEVETLTVKTEYAKTITAISSALVPGTPALLKVTYDADGYVIDADVIDAMETSKTGDKVYSNANFGDDVNPDNFTAYEMPYTSAKVLKCVGRTLYTADGDVGLTLAAGAPVVVLQKDADGDLSVEEYTTIAAALDALENSAAFKGIIAADLNDKGTAEWIVISSADALTASGSSSSSTSTVGYSASVNVATKNVTLTYPASEAGNADFWEKAQTAVYDALYEAGYEVVSFNLTGGVLSVTSATNMVTGTSGIPFTVTGVGK